MTPEGSEASLAVEADPEAPTGTLEDLSGSETHEADTIVIPMSTAAADMPLAPLPVAHVPARRRDRSGRGNTRTGQASPRRPSSGGADASTKPPRKDEEPSAMPPVPGGSRDRAPRVPRASRGAHKETPPQPSAAPPVPASIATQAQLQQHLRQIQLHQLQQLRQLHHQQQQQLSQNYSPAEAPTALSTGPTLSLPVGSLSGFVVPGPAASAPSLYDSSLVLNPLLLPPQVSSSWSSGTVPFSLFAMPSMPPAAQAVQLPAANATEPPPKRQKTDPPAPKST